MFGSAFRNSSATFSAACESSASDSSISVQTQYAWRPPRHHSPTRSITSARREPGVTRVNTGLRPGGSSSMTDTSMSAYSAMVRVRGMGVAVMMS